MVSRRYKQKREERRIRSLARAVLVVCASVSAIMFGSLSIKLFMNGIFFKGVENVSAEVEKVKINIPALTETMTQSLLEAGFSLFQNSIQKETNALMAPYTTLMTLGMLQNGAAGQTLDEIEKFFGKYTMSEMNSTYAALHEKVKAYTDLTCNMTNSIWFKQCGDQSPKDYFLKLNATYYGADLFMADFSKDNTLNKMNEWVKTNTEGKIVNPIEKIGDNAAIYVLNSFDFKGKWLRPYESSEVLGGDFKLTNGEKKTVKYMYSKETYLEGDKAEGVIKPYVGNNCSFVAIRPTDGRSIYDYVRALDTQAFKEMIHSKSTQKAIVAVPKFTYESKTNLQGALKAVGIEQAFDRNEADFSKVFEANGQQLYLNEVMQRNYIQLDETGTSSAGLSVGEVKVTTKEESGTKSIIFDTPFLYAIVDNETNLPLVIGIMVEPQM